MQSSGDELSSFLHAWYDGDRTGRDKLIPLVYDELRPLAHQYMRREQSYNTMQTIALINEAFLRLVRTQQIELKARGQNES